MITRLLIGLLPLLLLADGRAADRRRGTPALATHATADSTWQDHNRAADDAAKAKRWQDYLYHVGVIDTILRGLPGVTVGLARGYAQTGQPARAIALLRELAASGIVRPIATDSLLAPLQSAPGWSDVVQAFAANGGARGRGTQLFTIADTTFAAEDIAYDARRKRVLISSLAKRTVAEVGPDGQLRPFLETDGPVWGVFALGIDAARDRLWVTTAADEPRLGLAAGEKPRAAILRVALATGIVERRYDLPSDGTRRIPGDLAVSRDGDVAVGDARSGALYYIRRDRDSLETLVPDGGLLGPQQPAFAPDGRTVLVADYPRGIAAVDRRSGQVRMLTHPRSIVVTGIDGLIWLDAHTLAGIQNGVVPNRVIRITVDDALRSITRTEVLLQGDLLPDPTHATVIDGALHVIARSAADAIWNDTPATTKLPPAVVRVPF
jgi:hypothetical protein